MIEIRYVSSDGKEYGLVGDKMRATDGSMHKYEWDVEATETRYGEKVGRFTKNLRYTQSRLHSGDV